MIGDFEKLLAKGQTVTLFIAGEKFTATVKAVSVAEYERKYLLVLSNGEEHWTGNPAIRLLCAPN